MLISNENFLYSVFGNDFNRAHVCCFHEDPNTMGDAGRLLWAGGHWGNLKGNFTQGGNQYFCVSTFMPAPDGKARRRKALHAATHVITVDDVGYGPSAKVDPNDSRLLVPSYKLETSPGNEQWGYILHTPETNSNKVNNLLFGMISANLTPDGVDPGMAGTTRYVRLPSGTNNKEKYIEVLGHPFACALTHWDPFTRYTIETLAAQFDVDLYAVNQDTASVVTADPDHPGLQAFMQQYYIKSDFGGGRYDVTCPNLEWHTDMADNGTAIFAKADGRLGIKCHHGHCENFTGRELMEQLYAANPMLRSQISDYKLKNMFSPGETNTVTPPPLDIDQVPDAPTRPVTIDHDTQTPAVSPTITDTIAALTTDSPSNDVDQILNAILDLSPTEISDHIRNIARLTGRTPQHLRSALRWLRENRRNLAMSANHATDINFIHVNEQGSPLATSENVKMLLDHRGIAVRYNIMDRNVEFEIPNETYFSDSARNSQYLRIDSLMEQYGLNSHKTSKYIDLLAQYGVYHPFKEYLDKAGEWDGQDRIGMLCETLQVDEKDKQLRNILVYRWAISVPAAAFRNVEDQDYFANTGDKQPAPRGILTLSGPQYMGKTRWFRTLAPNGMFKDGLQLSTDKDGIKQATNKLIVEIGESDATIGGRHTGELKAFIGKDIDEVRLPWAKSEVRWPRRTVFGSTVNPAHFLKDQTGNSRWWVLLVKSINFALMSAIDFKQLWLQVNYLYEVGEAWLLTHDEMALLNASNEHSTTVSIDEDWLRDSYEFDSMLGADKPNNWLTTSQLIVRMRDSEVRPSKNFREILIKLTGGSNNHVNINGTTRRLWRMPQLKPI